MGLLAGNPGLHADVGDVDSLGSGGEGELPPGDGGFVVCGSAEGVDACWTGHFRGCIFWGCLLRCVNGFE